MSIDPGGLARRAHRVVDEVALGAISRLRSERISSDRKRARDERVMDAHRFHEQHGHLRDPAALHPDPPAPSAAEVDQRTVRTAGLVHQRYRFDSSFTPLPGEPGGQEWLAEEANRRIEVWVLRHSSPRPWIICVHGTSMGRAAIDLRFFRVPWLFGRLGLNVAVPVLPLHGVRRGAHTAYPDPDVVTNLLGSRQAVSDVRRVIRFVQGLEDTPVTVHGISLGGHVAALSAAFEPGLAGAIAGAPVVDLQALIEHHDPVADDTPEDLRAAAGDLGPLISPLTFPCAVDASHRHLYAGTEDRLVDPSAHASQLAEHWEDPDVLWYRGGHLALSYHSPIGRFVRAAVESDLMVSDAG